MVIAIRIAEIAPVTARPLYSAPMMLLVLPSFTKYVPTTEAMIQTAPISNGNSIMASASGPALKKIAPRSIVATIVTA